MQEIIVILITIFILDFLIQTIIFKKKYSQAPLQIKTFDGSDQPYHPSVMYSANGWNGFQYWMVLTPYPMQKAPYKDRWECPCIYCSTDGINWNPPTNFQNPLDDLTDKEIEHKDFFSDPHLVQRDNILECWYRISHHCHNDRDTYLIRKCSVDGIHWSEREILYDPRVPENVDQLGDMVRSPAILYIEKTYHMWYVDNKYNIGQRNLCYASSTDGKKWKKRITCQLTGKPINSWHIDVTYIDGLYRLTVYDLYELTLWDSPDGIHFQYKQTLLKPSLKYGSFYSDGLYRSILLKTKNTYACYFSAFDDKRTHIGIMQGKTLSQLKVVSCQYSHYKLKQLVIIYLKNRKRTLSFLKSKLLNYLNK